MNNNIWGTNNNDTIIGTNLDDNILALEGNDIIYENTQEGNDTVDGGEGFDRLSLNFQNSTTGVTSTLTSSTSGQYNVGNNSIQFSNIEALNIIGSNYDDVLAVAVNQNPNNNGYNSSNSYIDGRNGNDTLVADYSSLNSNLNFYLAISQNYYYENYTYGQLNAWPYDSYGNYSLNFNNIESLQLISGSGNDELNFDLAYNGSINMNKLINAGAGDDHINVSGGNDTVDGGEGFDRLSLNFQNSTTGVTSTLTSNTSGQYSAGNNSIEFSNIEALNVIGSNYDDVLVIPVNYNPNNNGYDSPTSYVDGGNGNDTLVADYSSFDSNLDFNLSIYQDYYLGNYTSGWLNVLSNNYGNYYSLNFSNIESLQLTSGSGNDWLNFDLAYNNSIAMNKLINAGAGDDYIRVSGGNDTVDGGEGFDCLLLNFQNSTTGVISTLTSNTSGQYNAGNNSVQFSNIEAVEVIGSNHDDILAIPVNQNNNGYDSPNSYINGADGNDTLVADYSSFDSNLDFNFSINQDYYWGNYTYGWLNVGSYNSYGNYSLNFSNIESLQLTSGSGNDWLNFDLAYNNSIQFNKLINAGAGDDHINISGGNDTVDGGEGFDRLALNFQNSTTGVTSTLTISNSSQYHANNNSVQFSNIEFLDILGSNYDDVLAVAVNQNSNGYDSPNSYINGADGNDTLVADYSSFNINLNFNILIEQAYYDENYIYGWLYASSNDSYSNYSLNFSNIESFQLTSGSGNDELHFDIAYNDSITMNKLINAGAGDDYIRVSGGNDTVDGGEGFDYLALNFQNSTTGVTSTLTSSTSGQYSDGNGNSVQFSNIETLNVIGSNYDDVLAIPVNQNNNEYSYFNSYVDGADGVDRLTLNFKNSSNEVTSNSDQYSDGNTSVYFHNIEALEVIGSNYNDFLSGSYGNDTLNGGLGNDYIPLMSLSEN